MKGKELSLLRDDQIVKKVLSNFHMPAYVILCIAI